MEIKREFDFESLKYKCWGEARNTLKKIEENGLEFTFMDYLETAVFYEEIPTLEEVNNFLSIETDYIWDCMKPFIEGCDDDI